MHPTLKTAFGILFALIVALVPTATLAKPSHLPDPIVSKSLDAVLMPINNAVRHQFGLKPSAKGVYVLAVKPRGVAAKYGISAGDVLGSVGKHKIKQAIDIDQYVWQMLNAKNNNIVFQVNRNSNNISVKTNITVNNYHQTITVNDINKWSSVDDADWADFVNDSSFSLLGSISDAAAHNVRRRDPLPIETTPFVDERVAAADDPAPVDTAPFIDERQPDTLPQESEPQADEIPDWPPGPQEDSDIPGADLDAIDYSSAPTQGYVCEDGTEVAFEALCPSTSEASAFDPFDTSLE